MAISTQIDNDLDIKIEDNIIGINHFRDQILLADGEKEIYDIVKQKERKKQNETQKRKRRKRGRWVCVRI